jgi:transcriptional regulator GlxA family with amidase domain
MFWCSAVDDLNKEKSEDDRIEWQPAARWVVDSKGNTKFWTSSGVSAGTDMSLAFIENVEGDSFRKERARFAAWENKYNWNDESENDPFRKQWRHGWC